MFTQSVLLSDEPSPQDPQVTFILHVVHFLLGMQGQPDKSLAFLLHISIARNKVDIKPRRKENALKEWILNEETVKWKKEQIALLLPLFITMLGLPLKIFPSQASSLSLNYNPNP